MTELLQDDEYERRFAGVAKIYGEDSFSHYEKSHVMVIGIGGVGSWAVEALARSGVGELSLVDMDVVAASNINRQLPAMSTTLGHEKIAVMAERCHAINPRIKINLIDDYLTPENIKEILAGNPDLILDCIDDVKAKFALMLHCRFKPSYAAKVFVKNLKKNSALPVSIQSIIRSRVPMSVPVPACAVVVMALPWW